MDSKSCAKLLEGGSIKSHRLRDPFSFTASLAGQMIDVHPRAIAPEVHVGKLKSAEGEECLGMMETSRSQTVN